MAQQERDLLGVASVDLGQRPALTGLEAAQQLAAPAVGSQSGYCVAGDLELGTVLP